MGSKGSRNAEIRRVPRTRLRSSPWRETNSSLVAVVLGQLRLRTGQNHNPSVKLLLVQLASGKESSTTELNQAALPPCPV